MISHRFRACLLAFTFPFFLSGMAFSEEEEMVLNKKWSEAEFQLPAPPAEASLLPFYVSAATANNFMIDSATLTVGNDGVVRYVLVIEASSGARSVSFEGMRCETREQRIYASGRPDGTWSRSRNPDWRRIRDSGGNRYHVALFSEYFCPDGVVVKSAEEALDALRRGGHPDSRH